MDEGFKMMKSLFKIFFVAGLFVNSVAFSADTPKTLVQLVDGKPSPALAKSWTKVKNGEMEFVIDTSAELMSGKALTGAAVKESLEKKLKTSHGVKVTPTSPDKVTIIFNGEEKEFFAKLAEVKIRAQSSDVADSSGSDGGIRARPPGIILADGEVRGFILKVAKEHYVFRIIETNSKEFKIGDTIDMKFEKDLPIKKNLNLYFVPEKKEDGFWSPKEGTLTR
jgi:hypothetical protein